MCGIIGIAGRSNALPVLIEGIRHLSYRGYDSAGVAIAKNGSIAVRKDKGRIGDLAPLWDREGLPGETGIGHTRWATHGAPCQLNAHPQTDGDGDVAVVHNGILENDLELRESLEKEGVRFTSETDTEVFAHLFGRAFRGDPVAAAREVFARCRGAFALVFMHRKLPGTLVALRRENPLIVGLGVGENLVASDVRALVGRADRTLELGADEIAVVTRDRVDLWHADGSPVRGREPKPLTLREEDYGKAGHPHFMHKEIYEQPERLYELFAGRVDAVHGAVRLDEVPLTDADWRGIERIDLLACGTAHFASRYAAYAFEALAGVPARAVIASEYDARSPALSNRVLAVAVSQSGETADTRAALDVARNGGARTLGVLNVRESHIGRMVDGLVDIHAGPEVGVASTKAYTGMLGALLLLALRAAIARGRGAILAEVAPELRRLPELVRAALGTSERVQEVSREIHRAGNMLFLGRGPDAATALEGALKMKEISYIHAEGYPAGEMKHGPIALVSWEVPTVAVATPGPWRDRMFANVREVRARDGMVILLAGEGDAEASRIADEVIRVPVTHPWLAPIVNVVPLQLLAYETAKRRGCDIDQPRNLAKTVTVQ